jgi:hypothetical protein
MSVMIRSTLFCLLLLGCHSNVETLELNQAAHMAYLSDRFVDAYMHEPVNVAIWEGTHFESWLDKNFPPDTPERRGARVLFHSRLSQLYKEAGESQKAAIEAQRAKVFFDKLVPNEPLTREVIVSNTLARDGIIRSIGKVEMNTR